MLNRQDIEFVRGDDVEVELKLFGDFTSETAFFTIKEKDDITGVRYVNLTTGDGIVATYSDPFTTFVMTIPKANTSGLTFHEMVWDLVFDEDTTKIKGKVKLIHDVRTPTDGLPSSETDLRFVLVDTDGYVINDMLIFDGTNLVNISLSALQDLLFELGGVLTTPLDIYNLEGV